MHDVLLDAVLSHRCFYNLCQIVLSLELNCLVEIFLRWPNFYWLIILSQWEVRVNLTQSFSLLWQPVSPSPALLGSSRNDPSVLLTGGIHGSAHVSVLSWAYCFLTNQWRVDFRGNLRSWLEVMPSWQLCSVLSTSSLLIMRFHRFGKGMSPEDTATESCKSNGVCSRKDGNKAKGCAWKTRGVFCNERCKCLATGKNSQYQLGFFSFLFTYFFRCIPNNSTQMNDHSDVF